MRRAVKVVYLDHCAQLSGGEIALARLLDALDGVQAHVILGEPGDLQQVLKASGASVEVMPLSDIARNTTRHDGRGSLRGARVALGVAGYSWRLGHRLKQLQPDLVHTNSLKSAVYGSLAARLAGIPVVCHLRDRLATDYMSASSAQLMRGVLRMLPQAVIANSAETMSTLLHGRGTLRGLGAITYDPVPGQPPRVDPGNGDHVVVGMVGRISHWKGQHVFIEAFARAFPTPGATAVIVGSAMFGEAEYEAGLMEQIQRLGLRDRVALVGFTNDVPGYLTRFDMLVHASVVAEPFGQVVVEGLAAGVPVIASDAGGPGEVITNGTNGLLVPPGNIEALASAMRTLTESPELRQRLGAAGRGRSADFLPDVIAKQVMAVYSAVLRDTEASVP